MIQAQYIGIAGPSCAGKSELARLLHEKHGYHIYSFRDYIRREIQICGHEITEEDTDRVAKQIRKEHGNEYFIQKIWADIIAHGWDKVVIESVRDPETATFLKSKNADLVFVDADINLRFQRHKDLLGRRKYDTFEAFEAWDKEEWRGNELGLNLTKVFNLCDVYVRNNESSESLLHRFEARLNRIVRR